MANGHGGRREGSGRKRVSPNMAPHRIQRRDRTPIADAGSTDRWIRGAFDAHAVDNGCWFSEVRGMFSVWWIEHYCRLYEGEWAGEPLILHSCSQCGNDWERPDRFVWPHEEGFQRHWDRYFRDRLARHIDCVSSGHRMDWQFDDTVRCYGWVKQSPKWKRDVRRFRKSSIWKAKKNKKSPTLAAWGLHQTAGDGENGQKVFFCAKDGTQARSIAGEHALAMIEQSEDLEYEFKINLNEMKFSHWPTRSFMMPMSSATKGNQKSKEGINGSLLVDETHVVDREFMGRVKRAGISRAEPLHCEFSTAGDDPESYGKERFDYAAGILEGMFVDDATFVSIHAADQRITDEEIISDPLRVGKLANPAIGHTVDEDEYLSDFNESQSSVREFAQFKQYRLNIWQSSSAPWLNMDDWRACESDFGEGELIGLPCSAALDLARKSDMTALVLIFRDGETFKQLAYFWLPEGTADRWVGKASYHDWARDGHLRLTPGGTADYELIEADIIEICERFRPGSLAFDPYYAEEITQRIADKMHLERIEFMQTITNFAGPCAAYERLLGERRLLHNGNPVLTWQAGHVEVREDANKNIRPVKEKRGSHKSIDGIVAGVMAVGCDVESYQFQPGTLAL